MAKPNYPCKQSELYLASRIGWRNFLTLLSFFIVFKAIYTTLFQSARIAQIAAAKALPDVSVRNSKVTRKQKLTKKKAKICRTKYQTLKSYINGAFPEDERETLYQEAGQAHYQQASQNNWEEVDNLMTDGKAFITNHLSELTAADNMPATFQASFSDAYDAFDVALNDFYDEEETEKQVTANKVNANNAVYDVLMLMLTDAQQIFVDDEDKRKLFTFEHLMSLVTNHVANLTGDITTDVPVDDLSGFEIRIIETDDVEVTDEDGNYDFGTIAAGTYTIQISKAGYITQIIADVEILTGSTKKLDVMMHHA